MSKLKIVLKQDQVILVTFGQWSESRFMLLSQYQTWLKTIEPSERNCVMVTPTDYDATDIDFMERSNSIIKRLESEISEQRELLATRLKQRRQG
jgi:hypothetical protein